MGSLDSEARKVLKEFQELERQIESMHLKVHRYLLDRSKYQHPRHEEFIQSIINYHLKGTRNRELELRLESLQFKAANRAKIWKQWFEDDAKGLFRKENIEESNKKPPGSPVMDKIYKATREAWAKYGIEETESKEDFLERIQPELEEARRHLQKGQKIIFTFNKDSRRTEIKIKEG
jgi:hypothetical protein